MVEFDAEGDFVAAWGWGVGGGAGFEVCTNGCQAGLEGTGRGEFEAPAFIEVDNSSGPSRGDVYVGDTERGDVQRVRSSGGLLEGWGEGGSIDFNGDGPIEGIAVDNSGSLFVGSTLIPPVSTEPRWIEIGPDGVSGRKSRPPSTPSTVSPANPTVTGSTSALRDLLSGVHGRWREYRAGRGQHRIQ